MDEIQYGDEAKRLLEDKILKIAVEGAKAGILNRWMLETDRTERDKLWYRLQAITEVIGFLVSAVDNATIARQAKEDQT